MVASRCPHCGEVLPDAARFCSSCGTALPERQGPPPPPPLSDSAVATGGRVPVKKTLFEYRAPPPPPPRAEANKTMLGIAAIPGTASSTAGPAAAQEMRSDVHPGRSFPTKLGVSQDLSLAKTMPDTVTTTAPLPVWPASPASQGPSGAADPASLPGAAPPRREPIRTILGVAMPGIAPTGEPPLPAPPAPTAVGAPTASAGLRNAANPNSPHVAHPSQLNPLVAKRHKARPLAEAAVAVRIVPRPPPLVEEPLPAPLHLPRKRGVPIAAVAGAAAVATLLIGGILLTLAHGTPAVTCEPRTAPDGAELLHVSCPACEPGAQVSLVTGANGTAVKDDGAARTAAVKVPFTHGEADVPLAVPLHVGSNAFELALSRPGSSRDDTVMLDVPVTYRITPDLSHLAARPPQLALNVEALQGSHVAVDGAKVTLDSAGHGTAPVDISADVEGPSDEMTLIERKLPYTVQLPSQSASATENGSLALRVGVAQLHLDSPGRTPVVAASQITIAGVVARTAEVYLGERQLAVGPDGRFSQTIPVVVGVTPLVLSVEQGASVATRTLHLLVQRVGDLQTEATNREAMAPPGYDTIAPAIDSFAGQSVIVEGTIVEARQVGRSTLLLVDDRRGCSKSPCLTRVLHGDIGDPTTGVVRAYGKVVRSFRTANGTIVPEIEADFVLPGASPVHAAAAPTSAPRDSPIAPFNLR